MVSTFFCYFTFMIAKGNKMPKNSVSDDLSIGKKMGEVLKLVGRRFSMAIPLNGFDLTIEQFILLNIINQEGEITQAGLSNILNKDKSGILRLTDELERKKLVVRIVDTADRRKKSLVLTKKGADTLNQVAEVEAGVIHQLMDGVTKEELAVFARVLDKIWRNVTA